MALSSRKLLVIVVAVSCLMFVIGLLIGHYAIEKKSDDEDGKSEHFLDTECDGTKYSDKWGTYKDNYLQKCVGNTCRKGTCHTDDLPRTYLAYHLNGKTINIDGKLDDPAWEEVGWTDTFMDIRGPAYPAPYFDTKVKVRWDDTRLYVGAWMQETDFWGNLTQDESLVWTQNAFEVQSEHRPAFHVKFVKYTLFSKFTEMAERCSDWYSYKEMQINVLNTTWDLMLRKAYIDNRCGDGADVVDSPWSSQLQKATFTDGTINDPDAPKGTYWSAEWSFSFAALAEHTTRTNPKPDAQEAWFFIFARPEYRFKIVNGQYEKDESKETGWWSWQPMNTVNLHLPSRFGIVQFKTNMQDTQFHYEKWHIYSALFAAFEAEHKYQVVNNMFVTDITLLDVEPKILSLDCVTVQIVSANGTDFDVSVKSNLDANLQTGHIRADRYVWFV